MITLDNFGPHNRDRKIGNSLYRICYTEPEEGTGKWYIHESYNDGSEWSKCKAFYNNDLQTVIDKINGFTKPESVKFTFP